MAAAFDLARVSANVPQRFYSDSSSSSPVSYYWHGRQYDHVQAWVNSLPQPPAPLLPPQHSHQQQQRPEASAPASFASLPQAPSERTTQTCRLPAGLDYVPAGLQSDRNIPGRQSTVESGGGGGTGQPVKRNGNELLLMKANQCSLSSDASALSSLDEILNERKGNPEELLQFLGFGSHASSLASRLPARFLLNPSQARGVQTDAIIARHPELLALKEPEADAFSATLLDKLPSYYQREVPPGDEADTFSSLHRRFSARLSAAGEAAQQQRRESISLRRSVGSSLRGGRGAPPLQGPVGPSGTGDRPPDGKKAAGEGAATFRQGFMHTTMRTRAGRSGPAAAATAQQQQGDGPATAQRDRMTASLSSLSDSVFMSNSDGAGDDDDLENIFDLDQWSFDYADLAASMSGHTGGKPPLRRVGSCSNDRVDGRGMVRRHGSGGRGAGAVLQKHHSFDTLELTGARPPTASGAGPKLAVPVTVLVTSDDGTLAAATVAGDAGGSCSLPPSGQLLVRAGSGHSLSVGSRTPTAVSPSFLSVVDSFESGESDTQTVTGDVPDECLSNAAGVVGRGGGSGAAAGTGGGGGCDTAAADDDASAVSAIVATTAAAAAADGVCGSSSAGSSRLLLAVVPAMESFEMEEIQSVGDPTRPRRGSAAAMNRSQSAQSDSSGFADTEDERQLVSPPTTFTSKQIPAPDGHCGDEQQYTAVLSPGINKMSDVVGAVLNLSVQRKRQALSREPHFQETTSPGSVPGTPSLASMSSDAAADGDAAAVPSTSDPPTTDDEYNSALDTLDRASSHEPQSDCDESETVACRRAGEFQSEAIPIREDPGSSVAAHCDCDSTGRCSDGAAAAGVQCRVTCIRSGPLVQRCAKEGPRAASVMARHLTLHGAPLTRQCAVDLNVALPLPDVGAALQHASHAAGSLVLVEEAEAEESCSPSCAPEAPECFKLDYGDGDVVVRETVSCAGYLLSPPGGGSHSTAATDRPVAAPPHGCRRGSGAVASTTGGSSEVSGRARSIASDTSSAVLLALLKPTYAAAAASSEGDMRLIQRAIQCYRATAYETDAALDARIQSLPDDLRCELLDEVQSLEDIRQSVAHEAVQLEARMLERLEAARLPKSASRCTSPLSALNLPVPAPATQGPLQPASAAGSGSSSRRSSSGVVEECTKLLKEQIYQQKLLESKGGLAAASAAAFCSSSTGAATAGLHQEVTSLQHQVNLLETKQKYEQRIAELEVTTLKLMLLAKEEEIKKLKLLTDID